MRPFTFVIKDGGEKQDPISTSKLFNQCLHDLLHFSYFLSMLAGLQIHIKTLNSIIPDSFIFILDSTDRSFIYRSSNCPNGVNAILNLDKIKGVESLMEEASFYSDESDEHFYMIKRLSNHIFLGFFALKEKFTPTRLVHAKDFFLGMSN